MLNSNRFLRRIVPLCHEKCQAGSPLSLAKYVETVQSVGGAPRACAPAPALALAAQTAVPSPPTTRPSVRPPAAAGLPQHDSPFPRTDVQVQHATVSCQRGIVLDRKVPLASICYELRIRRHTCICFVGQPI